MANAQNLIPRYTSTMWRAEVNADERDAVCRGAIGGDRVLVLAIYWTTAVTL